MARKSNETGTPSLERQNADAATGVRIIVNLTATLANPFVTFITFAEQIWLVESNGVAKSKRWHQFGKFGFKVGLSLLATPAIT
jgi:hypothetical protein